MGDGEAPLAETLGVGRRCDSQPRPLTAEKNDLSCRQAREVVLEEPKPDDGGGIGKVDFSGRMAVVEAGHGEWPEAEEAVECGTDLGDIEMC